MDDTCEEIVVIEHYCNEGGDAGALVQRMEPGPQGEYRVKFIGSHSGERWFWRESDARAYARYAMLCAG